MTAPTRPARRTALRRAAVTLAVGATVAGACLAGASPAAAMNPPQSYPAGVVNLLGGPSTGSTATFWATTMRAWGRAYASPPLSFYNSSNVGDYQTPCGHTAYSRGNSFYCSTNNGIYLDARWHLALINGYGDFGSGGILAHEWAHAIQAWLQHGSRGFRTEYHADCLAGMYVRHGYATGRLNGSDYGEFWNWLYSRPQSTTHGYGPERAAWYRYGYEQYSLAACNRVYTAGVAGTARVQAQGPRGGASAPVLTPSERLVRSARPDVPAVTGPPSLQAGTARTSRTAPPSATGTTAGAVAW